MYGDEKRAALIARTATFVALITFGGWLSIPFIPVPVTLQSFFVLLAGVSMKRWGVMPVTLYLLLGILNLPVFHNGLGGVGVLLGPTGGYLVGFIPAAAIIGVACERKAMAIRGAGIILATATIYLIGIAWLLYSTAIAPLPALVGGMLIFLPGDAMKGVIAYLAARKMP